MVKPSISVFFPCYNDKGTISVLVKKTDSILSKIKIKYEIIVIDDGSTDGSRADLRELTKKIKRLRLVFHKGNKGYGGALRSGFKAAKNDLIFYTDGDAQYDIGELELLIPLMTEDIDVVNGIKISRSDPWYRVWIGNIYNFWVRNFFGIDLFDTDCDFRLIRKKSLRKISLDSNSGAICVELIKKLQNTGSRFRQVSVHHYSRLYGKSQFFNFRRIFKTGVELIRLRLNLLDEK